MPSPVARQAILLSGTAVKPVWQANFLSPVLVASQTLPSGLTYTKSGSIPATLFDSTGKLTYQGNNLYINSGSATNTARTISTTAGINYYIWVQTSSGSATVVASGTNSTTFNGSAGGTFTAFTATTGTLTLTPTSNYANITQVVVAQITYESALRTADNVVTGASIYLAPRLDTNPSTLAPAGLLVEEQRVQLVAYSNMQATGTYWDVSTNGVTPSLASVTSPDGTSDGNKITPSTNNESHYFYTKTSYSAGTAYTFSFYAKAAGYRWLRVGGYGLVQSFDVQNGVLGVSSGSPTSTITSVGNGWYRVTMSGTSGGANTNIFVSINNIDSTTTQSFAGDGTSSIYFYGFQLEANSFPTSYIPNATASTVTRTADVVTPTTYASKASIWQRLSESAGTTARTYYAPGALPSPFPTGYWYQSMAAYPRALTTAEQTPRLVVGAPY